MNTTTQACLYARWGGMSNWWGNRYATER